MVINLVFESESSRNIFGVQSVELRLGLACGGPAAARLAVRVGVGDRRKRRIEAVDVAERIALRSAPGRSWGASVAFCN